MKIKLEKVETITTPDTPTIVHLTFVTENSLEIKAELEWCYQDWEWHVFTEWGEELRSRTVFVGEPFEQIMLMYEELYLTLAELGIREVVDNEGVVMWQAPTEEEPLAEIKRLLDELSKLT